MNTRKFTGKVFSLCTASALIAATALSFTSCSQKKPAAASVPVESSASLDAASSETVSSDVSSLAAVSSETVSSQIAPQNTVSSVTGSVSYSKPSLKSASNRVVKKKSTNKKAKKSVTPSRAVSKASSKTSSKASSTTGQKDLTNDKYKKIFHNFTYNYYCENVSYTKSLNYSGKITKTNAEAVLRTAIDQNQSGISVDKYTKPADFKNPYGYAIPRDIGEQIIKSCFDVNTVDPSLFKSYNAKTQKYELDGNDFASGTDCFAATVIRKITQEGNNIYVTADFYKVKGSTTKGGTAVADTSSKIKSMKFTFKVSGGKYLYEQAETI